MNIVSNAHLFFARGLAACTLRVLDGDQCFEGARVENHDSAASQIDPMLRFPRLRVLIHDLARQLSLEGDTARCSYVGTTSLAKGYGRVRLLTLA